MSDNPRTRRERRFTDADPMLLERVAREVSSRFINPDDLGEAIGDTLRQVGETLSVGRTYLFELREDGRLFTNTHEWVAAGVEPQIGKLQDLLVADYAWWWQQMRTNQVVAAENVASFPAAERRILEAQGIKAILAIPLFLHGELYGFFGFDETRRRRRWSARETGLMRGVAEIIGRAIERRQAEKALHESEEKYRSLIEHSHDAIYLLFQGKFEIINSRFSEILGVTPEEVRCSGFNLLDLVAPHSREMIRQRGERLARGEKLEPRYEFTALTKDGRKVEVEVSVAHVPYRRGVATQGILRDVTERKLLEAQLQQAQKMEAIGTLAGGIAHDFNNILTGIMGYVDLALSKVPPEHPAHRYVSTVKKEAERAAVLTRKILTFSRKQKLEMTILDLERTVSELSRFLRRVIGEDVRLHLDIEPGLPSVRADQSAVEQLLTNLCVNARDAMPGGGDLVMTVRQALLDEAYCEANPWAHPGRYAVLAVSDTGTGMDESTLARIFEPFFTTKQPDRGTGLGLSLVYGLVLQHGGLIYVESEPGHGSTFRVYLPAVDEERGLAAASGAKAEVRGGSETLLVVEDETNVRELIAEYLVGQGYRVVTAANGSEALRLLGKLNGNVRMVITDLVMPVMSGDELCERLLLDHPGTRCLVISGYGPSSASRRLIEEQGVPLLAKPFSLHEMAHRVREILDGGSPRAEA